VAPSKPTEKKPKTKTGRPPTLDEIKRGEICAILSVGGSRTTAARYVGCSPSTIRNTSERDPQFAEQLDQAESRHEVGYLQNIRAASQKEQYWRAAAWALERHYPDRYGPRKAGTISVEQITQLLAQFADIVVQELPDPADQQRIIARLEALSAALQPNSETERA
jgi:hypothetical protein